MTIKYVGSRAFDHPIAEFSYTAKEEERFFKIVEALEEEGWKIVAGIEGWAAIAVFDKEEYNEVNKDFQRLKKQTK